MKRLFHISIFVLSSFNTSAQLSDGSTAPDFTFQDIDGNTHNLYSYLNQGKIVALDISATWCVPCWNYHNGKVFDSLHTIYDSPGSQTWKTMFIEADDNTTMADLQGTGPNTEGDWITGTNYTIIAPAAGMPLSDFSNNYAVAYYPMFYLICPNKKVYEVKVNPGLSKWAAAANNCTAAGLDDIDDEDPVAIYPNPAREQVSLYFSLNSLSATAVRVINLTGKTMSEKMYGLLQAGDHTIKYDLSRLSAGIYFITITAGNNRSVIKKLIVR